MKNDNWVFFVKAKQEAPTEKIPNCEHLVENLLASQEITGINQYDDKLKKCAVWADRAHYFYYNEKDYYESIRYCNHILREISVMIYEPEGRFASVKDNSFDYKKKVQ